jgi:hypothetical protein
MKKLLLLTLFISQLLGAQVPGQQELQHLLDIDRFHTYTQQWALTMGKREGLSEAATAITKLTPRDIETLKLDSKKLSDAFNYDELIFDYLQKNHPQVSVKKENLAWGYDFYKRKLNDAYLVRDPTGFKNPIAAAVVSTDGPKGILQEVIPANPADILLDVDSYASSRSTRGVFWDASRNNRPVELHVGTASDFRQHLAERGAKVIGEIRTHARNYNPIYLIQDAGEKGYRYAITEISGQDRVRHYVEQSALIRWEQQAGKLAPPPPVHVVGDALAKLASEEVVLTQVLKVVPKADRVVLGQKGAFEKTFQSLGKTQALVELHQKNPQALEKILSSDHFKLVARAGNESDLAAFVMKNSAAIDKIYEQALPQFALNGLSPAAQGAVFNLDRGSYQVSDHLMKGKNGEVQRWRIFSNVWGDEVLPVAHALKATGHNNIVYIGTAGGLPNAELKVGDLVLPQKARDISGTVHPIKGNLKPAGSKVVDVVTHVSTPFEESKSWLKFHNKASQVVEIETGYLAKVFNAPNDRMHTMLLISDLVGVEGETLAHASSSVRRKAQISAISTVINEAGTIGPVSASAQVTGLPQWLEELAPNRDPVSKFQVLRTAEVNGVRSKEGLEALLRSEPGFTTGRIETVLKSADERFMYLLDKAADAGVRPTVAMSQEFLEGRWNPTRGPVSVQLQVASAEAQGKLEKIIADLAKEDKNFKKFLTVDVKPKVSSDYIKLGNFLDRADGTLFNVYKDSALGFGGLVATETRTGGLKFVQVAPAISGEAVTSLAYFAPDSETQKLLAKFNTDPKQNLNILNNEISSLYSDANSWKIQVENVKHLDGGALAKIVPETKGDKLIIKLMITDAGLKNQAVVLEELIHLNQITSKFHGRYDSWSSLPEKLAHFNHPYQWAETVANARAGSPLAREKLARMELEAAKAFMDAADPTGHYQYRGLQLDAESLAKYSQARLAHAEKIYIEVNKEAKLEMKRREAAWKEAKIKFDQLEKAPKKLNDLVVANDRKGAKKLIETYLPWDVMEPSEQHAWRKWLDAMVTPDPKNSMIVFRGIDDDVILKGAVNGEPGLFSTVLSKNQGNYTRRLRSLSTMREKFGAGVVNYGVTSNSTMNPFAPKGSKDTPSLLHMMHNHATNPQGSPFLSASNHQTASYFGKNKRVALQIDKNRLVNNAMAFSYLNESEILIPLVVFPDEVIHSEILKSDNYYGAIDNKEFITEVEKKIGRPLTHMETYGGSESQFVEQGYKDIKELLLDPDRLPAGSAVCTPGTKGCNCVFGPLEALLK